MANYVYIAVSLDGYIAKKDGSIDWLLEIPNEDGSDYGFSEFLKNIDAVIMGRNTYEKVLTFNEWSVDKPVFVLSNSLQSIDEKLKNKIEIIRGAPESVLTEMKARKYKNVYIDGGKTIQGFIKQGLVDVLIITRGPILLGGGYPLFGKLLTEQTYAHLKTEVLNNTLVKSYYKKINN
jgi:dihydrofolate reductase